MTHEETLEQLAAFGYERLREAATIKHAYATADGWSISRNPKMSEQYADTCLASARALGLDPDALYSDFLHKDAAPARREGE